MMPFDNFEHFIAWLDDSFDVASQGNETLSEPGSMEIIRRLLIPTKALMDKDFTCYDAHIFCLSILSTYSLQMVKACRKVSDKGVTQEEVRCIGMHENIVNENDETIRKMLEAAIVQGPGSCVAAGPGIIHGLLLRGDYLSHTGDPRDAWEVGLSCMDILRSLSGRPALLAKFLGRYAAWLVADLESFNLGGDGDYCLLGFHTMERAEEAAKEMVELAKTSRARNRDHDPHRDG